MTTPRASVMIVYFGLYRGAPGYARDDDNRASTARSTTDPATRAERLRRLTILQHRFEALPVDNAVTASYGMLAAAVAQSGCQPRSRVMDLLIAATAHAHDARLYTRNADDLKGLADHIEIIAV